MSAIAARKAAWVHGRGQADRLRRLGHAASTRAGEETGCAGLVVLLWTKSQEAKEKEKEKIFLLFKSAF